MLGKKQLVAYCKKQYKLGRMPFFSAYAEFLDLFFAHFIEEDHAVDDLAYYADLAQAQFERLKKHKGKLSVEIKDICVQRDLVYNYTRVFIGYADLPFVIDSIRNALLRLDCRIVNNGFLSNLAVKKTTKTIEITKAEKGGESFIWLDIENYGDADNKAIQDKLMEIYADVSLAVEDWRRMQDKLRQVMFSWRDTPEDLVSEDRLQTYISFMEWMLQYFTFLGYQGYRYSGNKKVPIQGALGLSGKKGTKKYKLNIRDFPKQLSGELCPLMLMTQTHDRSTVHRDTYQDLLVLRVYCAQKKHWVEEHYFTGLLTADAYASDPSKIPLLSQKFEQVLAKQNFNDRYFTRQMEYILKSFPREELFQADVRVIADFAYKILMIQGTDVARLFLRKDICDQYYSAMVYVPRSIFTTRLRMKVQTFLKEALQGFDVQYMPFLANGVLTRLYFIVRINPEDAPLMSVDEMQKKLQDICSSWDSYLYDQLCHLVGQKKGYQLSRKYNTDFSEQYRNTYLAKTAALDIVDLESLTEKDIALRIEPSEKGVSFRLFQTASSSISLKEIFPLLSHYGFCVRSEKHFDEYVDKISYSISEYFCELLYDSVVEIEEIKTELNASIVSALMSQKSDDFSALLVIAGIRPREIDVIRALCNYLHQIKFPLSLERMSKFFIDYPMFSQSLMRYFNTKFQPKMTKRDTFLRRYEKELNDFTDIVKTSDEERFVREITSVLKAIVRTNYCLDNQQAIVFKIESGLINCMPKPAPLYEYMVYSHQVMGVHLRFSRVARGGIRNSDRMDDVRHEVLELAKTQRLKNTLIVPDGAKGGFVCKKQPQTEEDSLNCYRIFIRSMLSLTDNYVQGKVKRDSNLVIYDEDDPYFVVAADKGTATFSPHANAIAIENGYWLGDAFASGGEHGYDHKKMAITAKGAWESVKWHFLSKQHNVYKDPFSVVGIGDMSGDVFGNGMLLSDKIRLVAAFNYAYIFIDPNPNEKTSYQERMRLFQLPKSNWNDYKSTLISNGGGVFSRFEKNIALTPQMKKLFSTSKVKMDPSEMIREILKLPVDLIWTGGIGVYVKSSKETHYEVSDFQNDACRVDACELKASVVGEGGNNGFTQLARVEYAQAGGELNTDFIDNSAGVNTSDVEVNFKILFQSLLAKKAITLPKRNHLLAKMSHQVSAKVLRNNFLQNVQINLVILEMQKRPDPYIQLIESLETRGLLDRNIEKIPSKRELEFRKKGLCLLTRPEISVLLSYSKISLYDDITQQNLGHHDLTHTFLTGYFPNSLVKQYIKHIDGHLLRDELVATELTNSMMSEVGILFVPTLTDECNVSSEEVVMAYLIVRKTLNLELIYETLYQHVNQLSQETFLSLLGSLQRAIFKSCRRLIRNQSYKNVDKCLKEFENIADLPPLLERFPKKYIQRMRKIREQLIEAGISQKQSDWICESRYFYQRFAIQSLVNSSKFQAEEVIQVYYQIAHTMGFHKLRDKLATAELRSRWDGIQRASIDDDIGKILELLVTIVLRYADKKQLEASISFDRWSKENTEIYLEMKRSFNEISELTKVDLSVFLVIINRIRGYLQNV